MRFKEFTDEWNSVLLCKLGTLERGKSKHRPRDDEALFGGEYPFIQTGEVRKANLYIDSYENTYSEFGLQQSKLWPKGTLCITIAANIAETGILKFDACFPDSVIGFNSNSLTSNIYIKYYFDYYKNRLQKLSVGGAQDNLNLDKLNKVFFKIPSIKEQEKILKFLTLIDERIETQNKIIEDYINILNCARSKIFSKYSLEIKLGDLCKIKTGKIDVNQMNPNGKYPFFTCGRETLRIDTYDFDCEAILISGNGDIGHTKYYNGKFNAYQRTYVLYDFKENPLFLKHAIDTFLPKKVNEERQSSAMPYIKLSTLNELKLPIMVPKEQRAVNSILDFFEQIIYREKKMLSAYKKQKAYLLKEMFI